MTMGRETKSVLGLLVDMTTVMTAVVLLAIPPTTKMSMITTNSENDGDTNECKGSEGGRII